MISIVSQPSTNNYINSPIKFVFNMTDIDTEEENRSFGYRLLSVTESGAITPDLVYYPEEGVDFEISFEKDIYNSLQTPYPTLSGTHGTFTTIQARGLFKLEFWEIVFHKPTEEGDAEIQCTTTIENEDDSNEFYVLNAAFDFKDSENNLPATFKMTDKPRFSEFTRGIEDFIYLYQQTPSSVTLDVTCYDDEGNSLFNYSDSGGGSDNVTRMSVLAKDFPEGTEYVTVNYIVGIKTFTYSFRLVDECCDHLHLYFQSKGGGFNAVYGRILETVHSSNSNKLYRTNDVFQQWVKGNFVANKNTNIGYKAVIRVFELCGEDSSFYDNLVSSGKYYVKLINRGSEDFLQPVAASFNDLRHTEGLIEVTLEILQPQTQPNYYL